METTAVLNLTESAIAEVKGIIQTQQLGDGVLRVGVASGGCSGKTYKLSIEKEAASQDHSFEAGGVRVVVDPQSAILLEGMTLDFSRSLTGGGFKFSNPNAKHSCGCGESFSA